MVYSQQGKKGEHHEHKSNYRAILLHRRFRKNARSMGKKIGSFQQQKREIERGN